MVNNLKNINKKTIQDININKKRILLRTDYNVPLDTNGNISAPKTQHVSTQWNFISMKLSSSLNLTD